MKQTFTKSHEFVVNTLKENGYNNFIGGIQLFTDQFDKEYSLSIDYNSTGIHVKKSQIDEHELQNDELIKICRSWVYKD